jgi:hypothetical protein
MGVSESSSPRTKIWLVVAGVIVLAAVGYVAKLYPPSRQELTGSVVPADRYRADTGAANGSVALGDQSIAQFMQTDVYRKIVADKALASAFASDAFRQALGSDAFRQALGSDAFRQAMGSDAFRQALGSDAFRQALGSDAFRQALGSDAFRQALGNDAARAAAQSQ